MNWDKSIDAAFAIGLCGTLYVASVLVFLHLFRRDLDVLSSPISEYAIGSHGRWMTSALWVWCGASVAIAVGILATLERSISVLLGTGLLAVFGVGLAIAAVFQMDVPFPPQGGMRPSQFSRRGLLHIMAATLSTVCLPIAALILSAGFGASKRWQPAQAPALALAYVCLATTIAFFVVSTVSVRHFGIAQRVFVAADLLWLTAVALMELN